MNDNDKHRLQLWKTPLLTAVLLLAILAVVTLFVWWMAVRADHEIRADLLQQARLVVKAISVDNVKALTGTSADLNSSVYHQLKEQLTAVRSANPECRFLALMGRKADGKVFFFVDSEPTDSRDYSPPGQVFTEVPVSYRRVFNNKAELVEGPFTDRWGTWVSPLVPLIDPHTNTVLAMLGMAIDAHAWKWDVVARAALPVGLLLVLLIGMTIVFSLTRRVDVSPKPVLRRLLPSLTVMIILLMAGTGLLLYQQHQQWLANEITTDISAVSGDLRATLEQQTSGLAAAAQPIVADATVQQALRMGDATRLLAVWRPVFKTLQRENHLTHFYFIDKNRVCLLRLHQPEKRGDRIARFTLIEAERTGKIASGIELGPLGTSPYGWCSRSSPAAS